MGQIAGTATKHKTDQLNWFGYAVFSSVPVLLVAYLCSHYANADALLGLFFVEWVIVLAVWRVLCPWLGRRSVVFAAVPFLLSLAVAHILVQENLVRFEAVWQWSDDWWFLSEAEKVARSLHASGWSLKQAWMVAVSHRAYGGWTLAGWPFVLGLVGAFVTAAPSLEMLHAIALSLNAACLSLVLALFCHLLEEPSRRFPRVALLFFLLLIGDPIVYAAMSRKESMLQLCLMLVFVSCVKLSRRLRLRWVFWGLLGMIGVATNRTAYIPLLLVVFYWSVMDRIRMGLSVKIAVGLILVGIFAGSVLGFRIRSATFSEIVTEERLGSIEESGDTDGLALSIYNIPLIGPPLYYAISPPPPLPWKIMLYRQKLATTLIRGAGSMAWFFSFCYVAHYILFRNRALLRNKLFLTAVIMFGGLFAAVVLTGSDPRYKQPTNVYLAIMLFMTWYEHKKQQGALPDNGDVSNGPTGSKEESEDPEAPGGKGCVGEHA